jgi:hypothetical protein
MICRRTSSSSRFEGFETSATTRPKTQRHIAEDYNVHLRRFRNTVFGMARQDNTFCLGSKRRSKLKIQHIYNPSTANEVSYNHGLIAQAYIRLRKSN